MTHSEKAVELVASFEGFSAVAYLDGNSVPTIGIGHTAGVKMGDTCTRSQAYNWLNEDLNIASDAVGRLVKVPIAQNQMDALTSLVYNIGQGHFASSTCLRLLNESDFLGAANAMLMWVKIAGKDSPGLIRRRNAERELFNTPDEAS